MIPFAKKQQIIAEIYKGTVHQYTYDVMMFLLKKPPEHLLTSIIEAVFDLNRKHNGIQKAAIRMARRMSDGQKDALTGVLEGLTNRRIEASYEQDESLLGGIVVRLDDKVYDGSVSRQLQRLRQRFVSGTK